MKRFCKNILAIILCFSLLIGATVPAFAATDEEYICELRLVYADSYKDAQKILEDSEFSEYELLNENLNEDTGKTGVWLAYKTTTDIEDAITDMSVMQMAGGYKEGNYQEMIEESYAEYLEMGEIYLQAIRYFNTAYDADYFLAKAAHRQLNFYNVVSEGIPAKEIPSFEGELLGDIFYDGISNAELATMFFQGNLYALKNIRSLLAMGVSYNADGKTYLDKVGDAVAAMNANSDVYSDGNYDDVAAMIDPSITVIKEMLMELDAYEADLDYNDDDFSDEELKYAEHKAIADMLRDVEYLDGKTLYQFCLEYEQNKSDYSNLYPLVAALNDGQLAMTKVSHFYDVVRYSISFYPEDLITSEIDAAEEIYSEHPFNVYTGVDRSIYSGTFALTNEAYRADVYGEGGISDALFGGDRWKDTAVNLSIGTVGAAIFVAAIVKRGSETAAAAPALAAAEKATAALKTAVENVATQNVSTLGYEVTMNLAGGVAVKVQTYGDVINALLSHNYLISSNGLATYSMFDKYQLLMSHSSMFPDGSVEMSAIKHLSGRLENFTEGGFQNYATYQATINAGVADHLASNLLFLAGGILLLVSAFRMGMTVHSYYNPAYEDIPIALVDLIETVDGDRYIKYDAVYEVEARKEDIYIAGDLNAYEGQRWNALYYTKSYEAGKPLLADEFSVSNTNNKPKTNYAPVHRFGEVVCYDLNKYNFDDDTSIYLSVKQSKHKKSAVEDVPDVIGSIFSDSMWILVASAGVLVGVGGTIGTQWLLKKKRKKPAAEA